MTQEKKERQSNFELLRILLMLTIPVYHLMLYNGVFYMDYHKNVAPGLFLSSGGAITADYAFIALTSYFLLESKDRPVIRRFLTFGAQVLTLYVIRFIVIRGLWGFHSGNWFVEDYILGWSMVVRSTLYGPAPGLSVAEPADGEAVPQAGMGCILSGLGYLVWSSMA